MNFEKIYEEYKDRIFNLVLQYVPNMEEAEEITQDVFIAVHDKLNEFRGEAQLSTWIYRIAINRSLDHLRAKKRRKRLGFFVSVFTGDGGPAIEPADFDHPGARLEYKEQLRILYQNLSQLSENQRTTIILIRFEGRTIKEVANIMNMSPKAVESLFQRAKLNLEKMYRSTEGNQK